MHQPPLRLEQVRLTAAPPAHVLLGQPSAGPAQTPGPAPRTTDQPHTRTDPETKPERSKTKMARIFVHENREHPDPDPNMTVEQVQRHLALFYGDLTNATYTEKTTQEHTYYTFTKRVGTKGRSQPCR